MSKRLFSIKVLPGILLAVLSGTLFAMAAAAAPVTVSFTKNDASGSGSLSGTGPNVSGFLVYDSDSANASTGNPGDPLLVFDGVPYEYSVQIDNFGTLSGSSIITQVGDNGAVLPGQDTFQVVSNGVQYQVSIVWSGPTSTFSGNGIPDLSVLSEMSPQLNIFNKSTFEFEMIGPLTSLSMTTVPVPAAAWLFGSGLLGLAGIARRMNTRTLV
ncbi:MAG: VPLPA-CTERM sorting domain-containing protein [Pseudomonadota bacterium]